MFIDVRRKDITLAIRNLRNTAVELVEHHQQYAKERGQTYTGNAKDTVQWKAATELARAVRDTSNPRAKGVR